MARQCETAEAMRIREQIGGRVSGRRGRYPWEGAVMLHDRSVRVQSAFVAGLASSSQWRFTLLRIDDVMIYAILTMMYLFRCYMAHIAA